MCVLCVFLWLCLNVCMYMCALQMHSPLFLSVTLVFAAQAAKTSARTECWGQKQSEENIRNGKC